MKAMILAAGKGTRLLPLTQTTPKALVPLLGVPVLTRITAALKKGGVTHLALNAHHLADQVEAAAKTLEEQFSLPVTLFREEVLLNTGGGLYNARSFWGDDPLLVWNGDILCDVNPLNLMAAHLKNTPAIATLVVQNRPSGSHLLVDEAGDVVGLDSPRRNKKEMYVPKDKVKGQITPLAFNGISVLSPALHQKYPKTGPHDLIETLAEAIKNGGKVATYNTEKAFYGTSGSTETLKKLEQSLPQNPQVFKNFTP